MNKVNKLKIEELYSAILLIKNATEAQRFFRDLLTESELIEFSNRWKAAKMLADKKIYTEIEKETGLSSRTIARVAKWLKGDKKGYSLIVNRLNKINHHNSFPPGKELS
jgi:TrpR-related protein YerC/YecD